MFDFLQKKGASVELAETIVELAGSVRKISDVIWETTAMGKAGTQNASGEEQIAMDVKSEQIIEDHLKTCPFVATIGSEELDDFIDVNEDGIFTVVTDPLDGSSLMDVNFAIGSIFGIYEGKDVIGKTGRDQVASAFGIYGPRTTFMVTVGSGTHEFVWNDGAWILSEEDVKLGEGKKHFAPGNLRATNDREDYFELVTDYMKQKYTLRYSGGMVPDVNHILKKGHGIFMYPGMPSAPDGKLRLLYECAPLGFLMEQAGGAASDGAVDILDIEIESPHQRTPIYIGTPEEVEKCKEKLKR